MQLCANGHDVYGFGERKTPDPFVNACTTFLYLDRLGKEGRAAATPSTKAAVGTVVDTAPSKAAPKAKLSPEVKDSKAPLSQDAKLAAVLRGTVQPRVLCRLLRPGLADLRAGVK